MHEKRPKHIKVSKLAVHMAPMSRKPFWKQSSSQSQPVHEFPVAPKTKEERKTNNQTENNHHPTQHLKFMVPEKEERANQVTNHDHVVVYNSLVVWKINHIDHPPSKRKGNQWNKLSFSDYHQRRGTTPSINKSKVFWLTSETKNQTAVITSNYLEEDGTCREKARTITGWRSPCKETLLCRKAGKGKELRELQPWGKDGGGSFTTSHG